MALVEMFAIILISSLFTCIYYYIELRDNENRIGLILSKGYSRIKLRRDIILKGYWIIFYSVIISLLVSYILASWLTQFTIIDKSIIFPDIPIEIFIVILLNSVIFLIFYYIIVRMIINKRNITDFMRAFD